MCVCVCVHGCGGREECACVHCEEKNLLTSVSMCDYQSVKVKVQSSQCFGGCS